jgi:hypothetical protein
VNPTPQAGEFKAWLYSPLQTEPGFFLFFFLVFWAANHTALRFRCSRIFYTLRGGSQAKWFSPQNPAKI